MRNTIGKRMIALILVIVQLFMQVQYIASAAEPAFSDIAGHYAEEAITTWAEKGYISGFPDGTFRPDEFVTRAQFVTLFVNTFLQDSNEGTEKLFSDVEPESWYYTYVRKASKADIIAGYPDGTFGPDASIKREDACVIVSRYFSLSDNFAPAYLNKFNDSSNVSEYAANHVAAVAEKGIIVGRPEGSFAPKEFIKRADAVLILKGTYDKLFGNNKEPAPTLEPDPVPGAEPTVSPLPTSTPRPDSESQSSSGSSGGGGNHDTPSVLAAPVLSLEIKDGKIILSWNTVTNATNYTLKRGTKITQYDEIAQNITNTTFVDETALPSTTYYYVVVAKNSTQTSVHSNIVVVKTTPLAPQVFGRVIGVNAILTWSDANGADRYNVYRSTVSGGPYYMLESDIVGYTYTDKGITENVTYYYVVKAFNEIGESEFSTEIELGTHIEQPFSFIPYLDDDGDGMTNEEELLNGTSWTNPDTLGDGLGDGYRAMLGLNPIDPDTSGDGVYDAAALALGLDPKVKNPMSTVVRDVHTTSGNVSVTVTGNSNLIIAPLQAKDSDNILLCSLEGIVGNPVDLLSGKFEIERAQITFKYTDEQLKSSGISEDDLTIFHVNYDTKELEPLNSTVNKSTKEVKVTTTHFSTYLLGDKNMEIDLSNVDIVFCIDQSGSMQWNDPQFFRLLAPIKFVECLEMNKYRAGIVEFESSARTKMALTDNVIALISMLNSMKYYGGGTNIAGGVRTSVDMFNNANRKKVIILLTDGVGTSPIPNETNYANSKGVVINTIAFGWDTDIALVQRIASLTGGAYFFVDNADSLSQEDIEKQTFLIYERLSQQLTLEKPAETDARPTGTVCQDFSNLYNGIESKEVEDWLTPASTNLLTGNFIHQVTDIGITSTGNDIIFERTYNSFTKEDDSIMGYGYRTNLDTKIVKMDEATPGTGVTVSVIASSLNVRRGPGIDYKQIGALSKGTQVIIKEMIDNWYKIDYKGEDAWIAGWYTHAGKGHEVTFASGSKVFFPESGISSSSDAVLEKQGDGSFILTEKDQSQLRYDSDGRLTGMMDRNGNELTVAYASASSKTPISITDAVGKKLTLEYSGGLVRKITDNLGRSVTYTHNASKQLTSVIDVDGNTTHYYYDDPKSRNDKRLTRIVDPNGNRSEQIEYDPHGRIVRQEDANNQVRYYTYDDILLDKDLTACEIKNGDAGANGATGTRHIIDENGKESRVVYNTDLKPVTVTDNLGNKTQYKYEYKKENGDAWIDITALDANTNPYKEYVEYSRGNKILRRETTADANGNESIQEFDKSSNLIKETDAYGNSVVSVFDSKNNLIQSTDKRGKITKYEYDSNSINLMKETDAKGLTTIYDYYAPGEEGTVIRGLTKTVTDKSGFVTTYRYLDAYNNKTHEIDPLGNTQVFVYDTVGRVVESIDARGNRTKTAYDNSNNVLEIADALNGKLTYTYDKVGNKLSETDQLGKTTAYEYDAKYQLIKTIDAMNGITVTGYDHVGNKVETLNAEGALTQYIYDEANRLITTKDDLGGVTSFEYDKVGNKTKQTDALGRVTTWEYDKLNREIKVVEPMGKVTTTAYDENGNVIEVKNALNYTTKMTYDPLNRQTSFTDEASKTSYTEYNELLNNEVATDANGNITTTWFDELGRNKRIVDAMGGETTMTYDANGNLIGQRDQLGRITTFEYDELNRKTREYRALDVSTGQSTTFTYDAKGNILTQKDSLGNTTSFDYDALGNKAKETNALGKFKSFTYDKLSRLLSTTDEDGHITRNEYDKLGRIIAEYDADGNKTTVTYDAVGNMLTKTNPKNQTTSYEYDTLNRTVKTIDAYNNSTLMEYDLLSNNTKKTDRNGNSTEFRYDPRNRLLTTIDPYNGVTSNEYDNIGNLLKITDPKNNSVSYTYDALNRKLTDSDQLGNIEKYEYDAVGNNTAIIDREGYKMSFEYDALDRLTKVIDALSDVTVIAYDLNGNVLQERSAQGGVITSEYDELNRLTKKTDANGNYELYTYDDVGNMLTRIDRNGITTHYTYDNQNRLLTERAGRVDCRYTYDDLGNILTMSDAQGTTTMTYDNINRLVSKTMPDGSVIEYDYDKEGNKTSVVSPSGKTTRNTYDKMNRLKTVNAGFGVTVYEYDANGNRTSVTLPSGAETLFEFDSRNILIKLINIERDGTRSEFTYAYDKNARQISKTESKGKTDFSYDAMGQLLTVIEPDGRVTTYTYDKNGNRKTQTVVGGDEDEDVFIDYTCDDADRLLQTEENRNGTIILTEYTYDKNGNQTKIIANTDGNVVESLYKFDEYNRLVKVTADGTVSEYDYWAMGLRAYKTVDNKTVTYYYDDKNVICEKDDEDKYVDNVFGTNLIARDGAETIYYLYNGHADVIQTHKQDGTLTGQYDYDVFGNIVFEEELVSNPYKYAGYIYDSETGYYYLRSRYYDPKIARFITEDTIAGKYTDPLSLNKYTYCLNDPVNGYDPDGEFFNLAAAAIGAAVGAVVSGGISAVAQGVTKGWDNIDWKEVGGSAASGAIGGLAAGFTMGGSLVAQAAGTAAVGFVTSGAGSAAQQAITTGKVDVKKTLVDATIGGVSAGATKYIGGKISQVKQAKIAPTDGNLQNAKGQLVRQDAKGNWHDVKTGKFAESPYKSSGSSVNAGSVSGEKTGQVHHALSKKIERALDSHETLSGTLNRESSRFKIQAVNKAAHRGYQTWHREYDKQVVNWLTENTKATSKDFVKYLNKVYKSGDLIKRFGKVKF